MTSAQKKYLKNNPTYTFSPGTTGAKLYTLQYVTEQTVNGVKRHDIEEVKSASRYVIEGIGAKLLENGFCLMHAPQYGWCYVPLPLDGV